eukprot:2917185-Pyramimonas_sp.AAC.1
MLSVWRRLQPSWGPLGQSWGPVGGGWGLPGGLFQARLSGVSRGPVGASWVSCGPGDPKCRSLPPL